MKFLSLQGENNEQQQQNIIKAETSQISFCSERHLEGVYYMIFMNFCNFVLQLFKKLAGSVNKISLLLEVLYRVNFTHRYYLLTLLSFTFVNLNLNLMYLSNTKITSLGRKLAQESRIFETLNTYVECFLSLIFTTCSD